MTFEQFQALQRGDQVFFNEKPEQIWDVDHPVDAHDKKSWKKVQENMAVPTIAGGGDCVSNNGCITISMSTPIGRGQKRLSQVINDYNNWSIK